MNSEMKITNHVPDCNIIKTPHLNHVKRTDWENVYEPAEDTFLLLDSLENDLGFIKLMKPLSVLEVGSGSGIIITALHQALGSECHCLAVDINPRACQITSSTSKHNHALVDVIQGDLTSCLKESTIDMIVFNPPYVVTENNELKSSNLLAKSWAGGCDGTEVINRFLSQLTNVMSHKSFGYILLLKENKPEDIMKILKQMNFNSEIIGFRKLRGEKLFVVKFFKNIDLNNSSVNL